MADLRFPTDAEQALIAEGVLITKLKYNDTNIHPGYHKWRDVWTDNLFFVVSNANPAYDFRAVAISYPMYFLDDANATEFTHRGYVCGTRLDLDTLGGTQIFPISDIKWVKPTQDA